MLKLSKYLSETEENTMNSIYGATAGEHRLEGCKPNASKRSEDCTAPPDVGKLGSKLILIQTFFYITFWYSLVKEAVLQAAVLFITLLLNWNHAHRSPCRHSKKAITASHYCSICATFTRSKRVALQHVFDTSGKALIPSHLHIVVGYRVA